MIQLMMERDLITRYGSELPKAQGGFGFRGLPLAPIGTGLLQFFFGSDDSTPEAPSAPPVVIDNNSPVTPNEQQLFEQYQANQLKLMEEYNNTMIDNMNTFAAGYQPPSMEDQMMMLGAMPAGSGNQVLDEDTIEFWEEHIRKGGTAPNEPDVNYSKAYENIHGELPDYDTDKKTDNKNNNEQNITNVYNVTQPPADDNMMPAGYVDRGFDPASDEESDQLGFTTPGRAQGLPLDYTNVDSPYYVGSEWSFVDGGQPTLQDFTGSSRNPFMPMYKKGGECCNDF